MLPSQQQAPVYVGPHGAIARLGRDVRRDVDGRDVDAASSDDEDKKPPNWMKARRQMLAQKAAADADERDTIAAKAVARMRAAARDAAQGGSATRDADQGVSAVGSRLEAVSLSSCSLTEAIDEEMQRQCLSALTVNARYTEDIISALAAAGSAACVCRGWRNFLRDETAWAQLAARLRVPAARVPAAGLSWRTGALRAHAERVALRRRWHNGVCADFCARAVHNDYVMAMQVHRGTLLTAAADKTVGLTSIRAMRRLEARFTAAGGGEGGGGSSDARHCARHDDEESDDNDDNDDAASAGCGKELGGSAQMTRVLCGHRGQVMGLHAHGDHCATCAADGGLIVWSLSRGCLVQEHRQPGLFSLRLLDGAHDGASDEAPVGRVACGFEGRVPVQLLDWRHHFTLLHELPDDEAPSGVTTCLASVGSWLAAGNTDSHSQLRVWDLRAAGGRLRDRFSLPSYCKGVRCLAPLGEHAPHELVAGCSNGWVVKFDLRAGRYVRLYSHADCVSALAVHGAMLISTGDDQVVRVAETRRHLAPLASHRTRSIVFAAAADEQTIYLGVGDGDVRCLDFSAYANAHNEAGGGFDARQKAALAEVARTVARQRSTPANGGGDEQ